jgi:L-asparaginase II
MLAYAKLRGWPSESYLDPGHPLQQEILAMFAELAGLPADQLALGTDGCSAPIWAAPLHNTAQAYARLMDLTGLSAAQQRACQQVREAMLAFPDMVAGPARFDTVLMQAVGGRILSKGGAEGYQALGLRAGVLGTGSPAVGIAFKISDGDARTWIRHAVAIEALRQLGALAEKELTGLAAFGPLRPISNWRGLQVGQGEAAFTLER